MDLQSYWQENKRFVTSVGAGLVLFLIAQMILSSMYTGKIDATRGKITRLNRELAAPLYSARDQTEAEAENEALERAVGALGAATRFRARPRFQLDPAAGSASNQYLRALNEVRDELLPMAKRANVTIDEGLGMPKLSPTRDPEIERTLEALDVVDTVARMALDTRVRRLDKIQIKLDPGLFTRAGVGRIERTRVQFTMTGSSAALTRLLARTQRPPDGRVLHVDELEIVPSRSKEDEVRLDLTIVVPRLAAPEVVEG